MGKDKSVKLNKVQPDSWDKRSFRIPSNELGFPCENNLILLIVLILGSILLCTAMLINICVIIICR
jgi:hypothetical protein